MEYLMVRDSDPQKPEWFQLADGDAPSAQVVKVNKKLPAIAVLVTGAVIATGAFFANASENEGGDQPQIETTFNTNSGAANRSDQTPASGVNPAADVASPNAVPAPGASHPGVQAPGGVKAPGGGEIGDRPSHEFGDDDSDGERENHDGREHHDGRERGERGGSAPAIPAPTTKN